MAAGLDELLATQGGVVTTAQALTVLTRRGLETHLKCGALQKVWYGVYSRDNPNTTLRLRGLDLITGTTVAACMGTAAAVYGFDTERTADLHVLNPDGRQLRSAAGLVVHRREGAPLNLVAGRPATTPDWTAIEVARGLRRPRALATLDAALRSRTCSPAELSRILGLHSGRRGIVTTREMLSLASPLAESPMESEARLAMLDGGLPPPALQYEIVDLNGRLWRLDFAWPEYRVAAEYDGVDWHSGTDAFRRDRIRAAALQDLSWVVVPIIAEDVRHHPAQLVRRIESRLARARAA
ncbi:endonuclease domain-containing protein [Mycobacterium paragordonae]|uniref:DUF559 domain-containing protein n=1 Tax=Mycobacterium paragordonae TaxID=1389713 RepID=A0A4R5WJ56_9MYCO|nr:MULTISPECIES: hypothetical protein [Mycobacterium]PJE23220.1 MAG: hypothetical protein CK431_12340 [Mycobacterium sp.]MDP7736655.1 hypothetical protein [Mycobacterium paragordonae]OBJ79815.1 hypothetical protein A9W97_29610 [Mycobacterium gordonae]TDK90485.1 hypothetical protein EUA02_23005 [Mycobacterium paragordonae]TDL03450.1 hypothetical protein EUA05_24495 [Mycobacterium paragordonae]